MFSLDEYILLLAAYFKKHDQRGHLAELRRYWRARQARRAANPLAWDEDFVIEWLATIRIPPFDRLYLVRKRAEPCHRCGTGAGANGSGGVKTIGVFPGGHKAQCTSCRAEWLVVGE